MNIIICLDDNFGMKFNNRRQSKDKILREKIAELCGKNTLFMNEYTYSQFEGECENFYVGEEFFSKAGKDDFCFYEDADIPFEKTDKIYAFFWNRNYPADRYFDFKFLEENFVCTKTEEFKGFSHEKITLKIYEREEI